MKSYITRWNLQKNEKDAIGRLTFQTSIEIIIFLKCQNRVCGQNFSCDLFKNIDLL